MEKKVYNVRAIGFGLTVLHVVLCWSLAEYLVVPESHLPTVVYVVLFASLSVVSIGVILLKEWARRLLLALNALMVLCLVARFIPTLGMNPLGYLSLNLIVFLYFTQPKVRIQFNDRRHEPWDQSVLVIDDDEAISKMVRPILLSHGFSVLTAGSGEDGIQIANTQNPDLILLDVILPGIKGREVCQQLKENPKTKHIPVVFLTAKDSPEDIEAERRVGSAGHLTKPVNPRVLIETVKGVLDSK